MRGEGGLGREAASQVVVLNFWKIGQVAFPASRFLPEISPKIPRKIVILGLFYLGHTTVDILSTVRTLFPSRRFAESLPLVGLVEEIDYTLTQLWCDRETRDVYGLAVEDGEPVLWEVLCLHLPHYYAEPQSVRLLFFRLRPRSPRGVFQGFACPICRRTRVAVPLIEPSRLDEEPAPGS